MSSDVDVVGDAIPVHSATGEALGRYELVERNGELRYRAWSPNRPRFGSPANEYPTYHQTADDARRYLAGESPTS